jgi:hypothetical protein
MPKMLASYTASVPEIYIELYLPQTTKSGTAQSLVSPPTTAYWFLTLCLVASLSGNTVDKLNMLKSLPWYYLSKLQSSS